MRNAGHCLPFRLGAGDCLSGRFWFSGSEHQRGCDSGEKNRRDRSPGVPPSFRVKLQRRTHGPGLPPHLQTTHSSNIKFDSSKRGSLELDGSGIANAQYYIATTATRADDRTRVLKYGKTFFVFDRLGDVQTSGLGEEGLFYEGMRYLSRLSLNLWNARPLLLSSTVAANNFLFTADAANLDVLSEGSLAIHRGTLHLVRSGFLWRDFCFEKLMFVNHGLENVEVPVRIGFDADFTDVFEVRGTVRERRGRRLEEQIHRNSVTLAYEGLDHVLRQTCIRSDANTVAASPSGLEFELALRPKERATIELEICCSSEVTAESVGYSEALSSARFELAEM